MDSNILMNILDASADADVINASVRFSSSKKNIW